MFFKFLNSFSSIIAWNGAARGRYSKNLQMFAFPVGKLIFLYKIKPINWALRRQRITHKCEDMTSLLLASNLLSVTNVVASSTSISRTAQRRKKDLNTLIRSMVSSLSHTKTDFCLHCSPRDNSAYSNKYCSSKITLLVLHPWIWFLILMAMLWTFQT